MQTADGGPRLAPEMADKRDHARGGDGPASPTYGRSHRLPPLEMASRMIDRAIDELAGIRGCRRGVIIRLLASRTGARRKQIIAATHQPPTDTLRGRIMRAIDRVEAESLVHSVLTQARGDGDDER